MKCFFFEVHEETKTVTSVSVKADSEEAARKAVEDGDFEWVSWIEVIDHNITEIKGPRK
jgi:DNA-dependent RNA polymerase auxiliary subunit epsilon